MPETDSSYSIMVYTYPPCPNSACIGQIRLSGRRLGVFARCANNWWSRLGGRKGARTNPCTRAQTTSDNSSHLVRCGACCRRGAWGPQVPKPTTANANNINIVHALPQGCGSTNHGQNQNPNSNLSQLVPCNQLRRSHAGLQGKYHAPEPS